MAKIKVYVGRTRVSVLDPGADRPRLRDQRVFVATTSKAKARAAAASSLPEDRWFVTSPAYHPRGIAAALADPGYALWADTADDLTATFVRIPDAVHADVAIEAVAQAKQDRLDARARRYEESKARNAAVASNKAAAEDWAKRLATEFGLSAWPTHNGRVEVTVNPEDLYGRLSDVVGLLRDCGIDDHPFQPQETPDV